MNSALYPWNGLRCRPETSPSTTIRATSSRSAMPASTSGGQGASVGIRASGDRDRLEQPRDDLIGVDAVGFRLEVEQDPVAQHRRRYGAHVLGRRGAPPFEQRARLGAEHERLAGAWTGAPLHPLTN